MFFRCKACKIESSIRMSKSYVRGDIKQRLAGLGWKVIESGWRMAALCPDCAKDK